MKENFVQVKRTDLLFAHRALDTAMAELEAYVEEGATKEEVLMDLEEARRMMQELLR